MASPINGHDWNTSSGGTASDLQYACIFPLKTPNPAGFACDDALTGNPPPNDPACQASDGSYSTMQRYGKAYPGQRHLEVLRDLGSQAIPASICPKDGANPSGTAYGFSAAMDAIVKAIAPVLTP